MALLLVLLAPAILPDWLQGQEMLPDIGPQVGLDFVHYNGMTGELYFPEMTGQGAAFFDADGDGDQDLFLVQGSLLGPGKKIEQSIIAPQAPLPLRQRLYRNDLEVSADGSRRVRLVDISVKAGMPKDVYGMGVATGDIDNDGDVDLYLAAFGADRLLRNRGDGTFEDRTQQSGLGDTAWSASATFFDYDRDGDLDLFVVRYVDFSLDNNVECFAPSSRRDYCGPTAYPGISDLLYRNRGDGTFEDVSVSAGVGRRTGAGLGVVAEDFNGDGRPDLMVANDGEANALWLAQPDGTFVDDALLAGVAVNRAGKPEASMGIAVGDVDGNGAADLFLTHLMGESNTLYLNDGNGLFEDRSAESGLAAGSLAYTSFGTAFFDLDNDGWLDLAAVSGAVRSLEPLADRGDPYPLDQPNQLFRNRGNGKFVTVEPKNAGAAFAEAEVSRGLALGDVDNDGDTDLLISNNSGPARLLQNQVGQDQPWLGLDLRDANGRPALGAQVRLGRAKQPDLVRRSASDGSYASANDPRVLFGLGQGQGIRGIEVRWPDGKVETWPALEPGRYYTLQQGQAPPAAVGKDKGQAGG